MPTYHRSVAVKFSSWTLVSAYGDAKRADPDWLVAVCDLDQSASQTVICGDLNWKQCYLQSIPPGWHLVEPTPTTTANTSPTRCLASTYAEIDTTLFVPGIPYHAFVIYALGIDVSFNPDARTTRERRTATYEWHNAVTDIISELHPHVTEVDTALPPMTTPVPADGIAAATYLQSRWVLFHRRLELHFKLAVRDGMASITRKAERAKGSPVTVRPIAPGPQHRQPQTIAERRIRRLHRAFSERATHTNGITACSQLQQRDGKRWRQAVKDGMIVDTTRTYGATLDAMNASIQHFSVQFRWSNALNSLKHFSSWSDDVRQHAKPRMVAASQQFTPLFTASQMVEDWSPVWAPSIDTKAKAEQWRSFAQSTSLPCDELPH